MIRAFWLFKKGNILDGELPGSVELLAEQPGTEVLAVELGNPGTDEVLAGFGVVDVLAEVGVEAELEEQPKLVEKLAGVGVVDELEEQPGLVEKLAGVGVVDVVAEQPAHDEVLVGAQTELAGVGIVDVDRLVEELAGVVDVD